MGEKIEDLIINGNRHLKDLKVVELRCELEKRGLAKYGTKRDLLQRLAIFEETEQKSLLAKSEPETPNQYLEEDSNLANDFIRDYFKSQKALLAEHIEHSSQKGESDDQATVLVSSATKESPLDDAKPSCSRKASNKASNKYNEKSLPEPSPASNRGVKLTIRTKCDPEISNLGRQSKNNAEAKILSCSLLEESQDGEELETYHRSRRKKHSSGSKHSFQKMEDEKKCMTKLLKIKIGDPPTPHEHGPSSAHKQSPNSLVSHLTSSLSPQNAEVSSSVEDQAKSKAGKIIIPPSTEQLSPEVGKLLASETNIKLKSDKGVKSTNRNVEPIENTLIKTSQCKSKSDTKDVRSVYKESVQKSPSTTFLKAKHKAKLEPPISNRRNLRQKTSKQQVPSHGIIHSKKNSAVINPPTITRHTSNKKNCSKTAKPYCDIGTTVTEAKISTRSRSELFESLKQQIELPLHVEKFPRSEKIEVTSTSELSDQFRNPSVVDSVPYGFQPICKQPPLLDSQILIESHLGHDTIPDSRTGNDDQSSLVDPLQINPDDLKPPCPQQDKTVRTECVPNASDDYGVILGKSKKDSYLMKNILKDSELSINCLSQLENPGGSIGKIKCSPMSDENLPFIVEKLVSHDIHKGKTMIISNESADILKDEEVAVHGSTVIPKRIDIKGSNKDIGQVVSKPGTHISSAEISEIKFQDKIEKVECVKMDILEAATLAADIYKPYDSKREFPPTQIKSLNTNYMQQSSPEILSRNVQSEYKEEFSHTSDKWNSAENSESLLLAQLLSTTVQTTTVPCTKTVNIVKSEYSTNVTYSKNISNTPMKSELCSNTGISHAPVKVSVKKSVMSDIDKQVKLESKENKNILAHSVPHDTGVKSCFITDAIVPSTTRSEISILPVNITPELLNASECKNSVILSPKSIATHVPIILPEITDIIPTMGHIFSPIETDIVPPKKQSVPCSFKQTEIVEPERKVSIATVKNETASKCLPILTFNTVENKIHNTKADIRQSGIKESEFKKESPETAVTPVKLNSSLEGMDTLPMKHSRDDTQPCTSKLKEMSEYDVHTGVAESNKAKSICPSSISKSNITEGKSLCETNSDITSEAKVSEKTAVFPEKSDMSVAQETVSSSKGDMQASSTPKNIVKPENNAPTGLTIKPETTSKCPPITRCTNVDNKVLCTPEVVVSECKDESLSECYKASLDTIVSSEVPDSLLVKLISPPKQDVLSGIPIPSTATVPLEGKIIECEKDSKECGKTILKSIDISKVSDTSLKNVIKSSKFSTPPMKASSTKSSDNSPIKNIISPTRASSSSKIAEMPPTIAICSPKGSDTSHMKDINSPKGADVLPIKVILKPKRSDSSPTKDNIDTLDISPIGADTSPAKTISATKRPDISSNKTIISPTTTKAISSVKIDENLPTMVISSTKGTDISPTKVISSPKMSEASSNIAKTLLSKVTSLPTKHSKEHEISSVTPIISPKGADISTKTINATKRSDTSSIKSISSHSIETTTKVISSPKESDTSIKINISPKSMDTSPTKVSSSSNIVETMPTKDITKGSNISAVKTNILCKVANTSPTKTISALKISDASSIKTITLLKEDDISHTRSITVPKGSSSSPIKATISPKGIDISSTKTISLLSPKIAEALTTKEITKESNIFPVKDVILLKGTDISPTNTFSVSKSSDTAQMKIINSSEIYDTSLTKITSSPKKCDATPMKTILTKGADTPFSKAISPPEIAKTLPLKGTTKGSDISALKTIVSFVGSDTSPTVTISGPKISVTSFIKSDISPKIAKTSPTKDISIKEYDISHMKTLISLKDTDTSHTKDISSPKIAEASTVKAISSSKLDDASVKDITKGSDISALKMIVSLKETDSSPIQTISETKISGASSSKSIISLKRAETSPTKDVSIKEYDISHMKTIISLKDTDTSHTKDISSPKIAEALTVKAISTSKLDDASVKDITKGSDISALKMSVSFKESDTSPIQTISETKISDASSNKSIISPKRAETSPTKDIRSKECDTSPMKTLMPPKCMDTLPTKDISSSEIAEASPIKAIRSSKIADASVKDITKRSDISTPKTIVSLKETETLPIQTMSAIKICDASSSKSIISSKIVDTSPTKATRLPKECDTSPINSLISPKGTDTSHAKDISLLKIAEVSPVKAISSLKTAEASPVKAISSPKTSEASIKDISKGSDISALKMIVSLKETDTSPTKTISATKMSDTSSKIADTSPTKSTRSPKECATLPMKTFISPQGTDNSSTKAISSLKIAESSPVKTNSSPELVEAITDITKGSDISALKTIASLAGIDNSPTQTISATKISDASFNKSIISPNRSDTSTTKAISSPMKTLVSPKGTNTSPIKAISLPKIAEPSSVKVMTKESDFSAPKTIVSPKGIGASPTKTIIATKICDTSSIKPVISPKITETSLKESDNSPVKTLNSPKISVTSPTKASNLIKICDSSPIKDFITSKEEMQFSTAKPKGIAAEPECNVAKKVAIMDNCSSDCHISTSSNDDSRSLHICNADNSPRVSKVFECKNSSSEHVKVSKKPTILPAPTFSIRPIIAPSEDFHASTAKPKELLKKPEIKTPPEVIDHGHAKTEHLTSKPLTREDKNQEYHMPTVNQSIPYANIAEIMKLEHKRSNTVCNESSKLISFSLDSIKLPPKPYIQPCTAKLLEFIDTPKNCSTTAVTPRDHPSLDDSQPTCAYTPVDNLTEEIIGKRNKLPKPSDSRFCGEQSLEESKNILVLPSLHSSAVCTASVTISDTVAAPYTTDPSNADAFFCHSSEGPKLNLVEMGKHRKSKSSSEDHKKSKHDKDVMDHSPIIEKLKKLSAIQDKEEPETTSEKNATLDAGNKSESCPDVSAKNEAAAPENNHDKASRKEDAVSNAEEKKLHSKSGRRESSRDSHKQRSKDKRRSRSGSSDKGDSKRRRKSSHGRDEHRSRSSHGRDEHRSRSSDKSSRKSKKRKGSEVPLEKEAEADKVLQEAAAAKNEDMLGSLLNQEPVSAELLSQQKSRKGKESEVKMGGDAEADKALEDKVADALHNDESLDIILNPEPDTSLLEEEASMDIVLSKAKTTPEQVKSKKEKHTRKSEETKEIERKKEIEPFKSARKVSVNRRKSNDDSKKRKWGSTDSKSSMGISSFSLKALIPDVKPLSQSELKLLSDSDNSSNEDVPPVSSRGKVNGRVEESAEPAPSEETAPPKEDRHHRRRQSRERDDRSEKRSRREHDKRDDPRRKAHDDKESSRHSRAIQIVMSDVPTTKLGIPPSRNPISRVITIGNLVRPFTVKQLKDLLQRTGTLVENGFWIDNVKSKCIAMFEEEDESVETRIALHGIKWPSVNPKFLAVDFSNEAELKKRLNETPHLNPIIVEDSKYERKKADRPMREWDLAKVGERSPGEKERERERQRRDRSQERSRERRSEQSPRPGRPVVRKPVELKSLDDLFPKTKAQPSIYWLPLTDEEIAEKEAMRRKKMAEHERREAEMKAAHERQRAERLKERQRRRERSRSIRRSRRSPSTSRRRRSKSRSRSHS